MNLVDYTNVTSVHLTVLRGNKTIIAISLCCDIDVNLNTQVGTTLLIYAVR